MDLFVIAGLMAVTLGLVVTYYQRVQVQRPPLGHFNWRDLVLAMVIVVVMPFLYISAPPIVPGIVFGLVWMALLTTTLSPLVRGAGLIVFVVILLQAWLCWHWITNVASMIMAVGAGVLFIRNGLRSVELALFAVCLMVYDFVATRFMGQMMELVEALLQQPFFIGFVVGDMFIAGGDILVLAIFTADITRSGGRLGYVAALLLSAPIAMLTFAGDAWADTGIPYMVIATPIYLMLLAGARYRRGIVMKSG